jgi:beta-glucanase (GH16 family)
VIRKLPIPLAVLAATIIVAWCSSVGHAATATTNADPSGAAIPTAPAGYRTVLSSDFNGHGLGRCWGAYTANPISSSPTGAWVPSRVSVADGMAVLSSFYDSQLGKWASGGMSSSSCVSLIYGIFEVRFKMQAARGVKYAILLWPQTVRWPDGGEIDFGEDQGGNRRHTTLSSSYGVNGVDHALAQRVIAGNFARWNTLKLVWTKGNLVEYLNGRRVARISSPKVPSDPMTLDIQAETNTDCANVYYPCINSTTPARVDLDVDWAVAFAPISR